MASAQLRKGEIERTWLRSRRVFAPRAGRWYFRTREGVEIGPYDTPFEAEIEAGLLKELLKKCDSDDRCNATLKSFIRDGLAMGHPLNPIHSEQRIQVVAIR